MCATPSRKYTHADMCVRARPYCAAALFVVWLQLCICHEPEHPFVLAQNGSHFVHFVHYELCFRHCSGPQFLFYVIQVHNPEAGRERTIVQVILENCSLSSSSPSSHMCADCDDMSAESPNYREAVPAPQKGSLLWAYRAYRLASSYVA